MWHSILLVNTLPDKLLRRFATVTGAKTLKAKWKSVVGLEVHAQITSDSKLFSESPTTFGLPVNSAVSFFDAAIPGTLPMLNRKCVESGVRTALALSCRVNEVSMFDRKHYFYADMPAGYQITQQRAALANDGEITFPVIVPGKKVYRKTARLLQLQLEQDSGKSLHDDVLKRSLIDLNRAGLPLMELVFAPDLETGEEAAALVKELVLTLKRLQTCSCRMEEGALRVDANISVHEPGQPFGVRTEVKNIGSIRSIAQAVTYEIERQLEVISQGGVITNETRSWDADRRCTVSMRDKEVLQDYRFMPEPNLPPLRLQMTDDSGGDEELVSVPALAQLLPELPEQTRQRLVDAHAIGEVTAVILVNEPVLLENFLSITDDLSREDNQRVPTKAITNFLLNDFLTFCNKHNIDLSDCVMSPAHLRDIIAHLHREEINLQSARLLLELVNASGGASTVAALIAEHRLEQITDAAAIEQLCQQAIAQQPKAVQQYRSGKPKALFAIAGAVAKQSDQKANMRDVVACLERLLNSKA